MSKLMLGLYAETFVHPGSGRNEGAIDLPVMRERVTGYPVVLGSSLKGALLAKARSEQTADLQRYFGREEGAGGILFGDARLLLLPVRSLSSSFKWIICPHIINRLKRDMARCGQALDLKTPSIQAGKYASAEPVRADRQNQSIEPDSESALYLEERLLEPQAIDQAQAQTLLEAIARLMPQDIDLLELQQRLVILADDDFAWFSGNGLPVHARNVLNKETKSSENLWYEEVLPPETMFYATLLPRFDPKLMNHFLAEVITNNVYLQIGGNETIGQGWVMMTAFSAAQHHQTQSQEVA